ncbi:MAG: AgmX/PglI C-terminal domain-containing protein, partial [Myxococcota bacterium]
HELSFEDTPRTLRGDVPIEVLEERGEWRRVRAETETHRIEGWMLADDVLSESEIPSYVTTREVAGLPAGTPIVRADRWFVLTTLQGREVLRALEHDVPDDARTHDETQRAARAFASTRPPIMSAGSNCWAPGDDLTEPGLLQRSSVRQVFRANLDAVRTCYENRLQWNQSLEGRVSVRLRIGPSGRTAGATVVHPGSFELAVEQCIARRILTWRFPRPEGGCVIVNYPFYLQPENSQPENSQP